MYTTRAPGWLSQRNLHIPLDPQDYKKNSEHCILVRVILMWFSSSSFSRATQKHTPACATYSLLLPPTTAFHHPRAH